jgi:hypothetical protein
MAISVVVPCGQPGLELPISHMKRSPGCLVPADPLRGPLVFFRTPAATARNLERYGWMSDPNISGRKSPRISLAQPDDRIVLSGIDARQGETGMGVRYVLAISTATAAAVLALIYAIFARS